MCFSITSIEKMEKLIIQLLKKIDELIKLFQSLKMSDTTAQKLSKNNNIISFE
jgi:hypothetical protein